MLFYWSKLIWKSSNACYNINMKNVVITGASKGIGAETARTFARNGFNVIINYNKSEKEAVELRKEIKEKHPNLIVEIYKCDVSDFNQCKKMIDFSLSILGCVDVLVANAGISQVKPIIDTNEADFNNIINTNLKGVYNSIMSVLPNMLSNKNGNIVAVSSIWGTCGASCETLYSASKFGIIGLCKSLARELGPSNIKINCVAPGAIETEMNSDLSSLEKAEFCNSTPLGRFGTPEEVANAIYFLSTSTFITGQTLTIDGGYTC